MEDLRSYADKQAQEEGAISSGLVAKKGDVITGDFGTYGIITGSSKIVRLYVDVGVAIPDDCSIVITNQTWSLRCIDGGYVSDNNVNPTSLGDILVTKTASKNIIRLQLTATNAITYSGTSVIKNNTPVAGSVSFTLEVH